MGAQMDMAEAADNLGLLDLAIWNLEQARQKQAMDVHLNRALAHLYEKRGNFTQAIALWELIRKARPGDSEAQQKIKNLAADDTDRATSIMPSVQSDSGNGRGASAGEVQRRPKKDGTDGDPPPRPWWLADRTVRLRRRPRTVLPNPPDDREPPRCPS